MATSAEELTNCVICAEVFTDPQVLPCEHVFCKTCVDRMKEAGTIKCPNCSEVCKADDVKPDFRLSTFLDVLAENTERLTRPTTSSNTNTTDNRFREQITMPSAGKKCESCEQSDIDSFCRQCEQYFCRRCKIQHGKIAATKHHECTLLTVVESSERSVSTSIHYYVQLNATEIFVITANVIFLKF